MPSEDFTPELEKSIASGTSSSRSWSGRLWSAGGLAWLVLFVMQLAMFAACTRGAWLRPDLEWVAWVAAGGALPMLLMRRIVPPSLLAAEPKWLFFFSLALLLAGGVIFTGLQGVLGETLFVTLGAFSLGMGLWLSALGMQGRPGRRERTAVLSPALEGPYIESLVKRPAVWLAMLMVVLVAAGVWFSASMWPRITASAPGVERTGAEAVASLIAFWLGIVLGAAPALSAWEKKNARVGRWAVVAVLVAAALAVGISPWWPGAVAILLPLVIGYAWARALRQAAEILRTEIPQSLEVRVASWLLTGSGVGALAAGLLAFSLSRSALAEGWLEAWARGPMTGVVLLLAGAGAAAILESSRRLMAGSVASNSSSDSTADDSQDASPIREAESGPDQTNRDNLRWIDFPTFELKRSQQPEENDGQVVEIAYDVPEENLETFLKAMAQMERIRLEEGAVWWTLTRDRSHPSVYHEFFLVGSWTEHQAALAKEDGTARAIKLQAFAANDWETMPAEIHYPVFDAKQS
jgi:quinol monooxygenase YgiN